MTMTSKLVRGQIIGFCKYRGFGEINSVLQVR
jgi:hypothetical protein